MRNSILAVWNWSAPKLPFDEWWFFGVALVLLVVFIWLVARLLMPTTDDVDPAEIDRQMLSAVNELRSQGELTQEEFRSIKSRLVTRLSAKPDSKQLVVDSGEFSEGNREAKGLGRLPDLMNPQELANENDLSENVRNSDKEVSEE